MNICEFKFIAMIKQSQMFKPLCVLVFAMLMSISQVSAQTDSATVNIQIYAGLTISGTVGSNYVVQYLPEISQTNRWLTLDTFALPSNQFIWFDSSCPANGKRFYRVVVPEVAYNPKPLELVWIPAGTFMMGSPTNDPLIYGEETLHQVTLTKGFYMGKFEVKQWEYLNLMGVNPSLHKGDTNLPVEQVTWADANTYCTKLTTQETVAQRLPVGWVYRLPTEAEWEYACRAGTTTRFSFGADPNLTQLTDYAWYDANSDGLTHPVGQKLPNPWGLYDMQGNVWEWCADFFGPYQTTTVIDPSGPSTGTDRIMRGGSVYEGPKFCRSSTRSYPYYPAFSNLGFRVVLAHK